MRNLRYLIFYDSGALKWRRNPLKYMPTNELRILEWPGYDSKFFPSSFQPKNLTVLRIPGSSRIKQLWKGSMVLDNLKEFDLSYSENLIEIPDLTGVPNLEAINLKGCRNLCELHPSIGSLKKLNELVLEKCSSLEKLPDLSSLECLTDLWAPGTAITQIPSINLLPKSIRSFDLEGRKLMRLKSRDPIGSLVEYQKEGIYNYIEAEYIDFDSEGENILDIAGGVVSALDDDLTMIRVWSWGFHIPEWVQYKNKGSSIKIDLDANTNPEMGMCFFIICDSDQLFSTAGYRRRTSISSLFKNSNDRLRRLEVRLTIGFETDEESVVENNCFNSRLIAPPLDVSFCNRIGFWVYIPAILRFMDIQRVISFRTYYNEDFEQKDVEVKECGVHLVCPDDANSNFFNSIAHFGRSGSSNSDVHRRLFAFMDNDWMDLCGYVPRAE